MQFLGDTKHCTGKREVYPGPLVSNIAKKKVLHDNSLSTMI